MSLSGQTRSFGDVRVLSVFTIADKNVQVAALRPGPNADIRHLDSRPQISGVTDRRARTLSGAGPIAAARHSAPAAETLSR